jgi:hypothetical protein
MRQRAKRQRQLFEDEKAFHLPQLPEEVQHQATRLLMQWMEALARLSSLEVDDEQDKR